MIQTKLNTAIRLSIGDLNPAQLRVLETLLMKFHLSLEEKNYFYYIVPEPKEI